MSETMNEGQGGVRIPSDALKPELPKRFYKDVTVGEADDGFCVLLDGRRVKTPAKRMLSAPSRPLAEAIAAEWAAQTERINPDLMPLTRILNSAIDAVAFSLDEVREDIVRFASSDLVCYRASDPEKLVRRQRAHWDPVLAWAETDLGARFLTGEGIIPVVQSDAALSAIRESIRPFSVVELSALHVMTTLLGSALLAVAHAKGCISADQAWAAAHVDEIYQTETWGHDDEAEARLALRRRDFDAASQMFLLA